MANIITSLQFQSKHMSLVCRNGVAWLSLPDIESALGYASQGKALSRVYQRHADEFSDAMTALLEVMTAGGKQLVRFFSLRGAHLLAMFARTPVAKDFRRWVLDILDREVGGTKPAKTPSRPASFSVDNMHALYLHMEYLRSWWAEFGPAIRALSPDVASVIHDHFVDGVCTARTMARTSGIQLDERAKTYPWRADSWARMRHVARQKD